VGIELLEGHSYGCGDKKNDKEDSKGEAGGAELKKGGRGGSERLTMGEGVIYSSDCTTGYALTLLRMGCGHFTR
jgi:hypothetical protein